MKKLFLTVFTILLIAFLTTCDMSPRTEELSVNVEGTGLTAPENVEISAEIALDSSSGIEPEELIIFSSTNVRTIDNKLSLPNIGIGQNLLLKDSSGNVVATAYVTAEAIESGNISIDSESLALGLIRLTPGFIFLPYDTEIVLLEECKNHSDFSQLKNYINNALNDSLENALDVETYPYIYFLTSEIAIDVIETYITTAYSSRSRAVSLPVIGEERRPYIADPTDYDFSVVNPKTCFYGMELDDSEAYLIKAKKSLFTVFPPQLTDPSERGFDPSDGNHTVVLYKGFGTSGNSDWMVPTTADGKATYANSLKLIASVLKVTGLICNIAVVGSGKVFSDLSSYLNDTKINYLLTLDEEMRDVDLSALVQAFTGVDSIETFLGEVIESLFGENSDNTWENISLWIWEESSDFMDVEQTMQLQDYMHSIRNIIDNFNVVANSIDIVNTVAPFIYDLITSPGQLTYAFSVTDGVVGEISSQIPPTANFSISNYRPRINESITLDASNVEDDNDSPSILQVRWDFNNDGTWDTNWNTTKIQTTSYTARGSTTIQLEVKDSDGLISSYIDTINVGSSRALKIVLTWGEYPHDLDSHIYTPSVEGTEHHLYYRNRGSLSSAPYCWLDLDDTTSYGPETIWFEQLFDGTYTYSVYNYSRNPKMSTSSAHVEVINGSQLIADFDIPENLEGTWWDVFTIDGTTGNITQIESVDAARGIITYNSGINKIHLDTMPGK